MYRTFRPVGPFGLRQKLKESQCLSQVSLSSLIFITEQTQPNILRLVL